MSTDTNTKTKTGMRPEVYETLREAVGLARHDGIRTVAVLRKRLLESQVRREPAPKDAEAVVDEALKFWADHVARAGLQNSLAGR